MSQTHANRLDETLLLSVYTCPPTFPPDVRSADRRVEEIHVKVINARPFQTASQVCECAVVASQILQLGREEDRITRDFVRLCTFNQLSLSPVKLRRGCLRAQILVDGFSARSLILVPIAQISSAFQLTYETHHSAVSICLYPACSAH